MTTVGIVGCGITGLTLVHHLVARGVDVVAFEANTSPGGVIHTTRDKGRILEHGPQRLRLTAPVNELVDAIGLQEELRVVEEALPIYVYADGELRRVPFSLRDLLTTDLLSWRGKARLFKEPLTAPGRGDETIEELFTRKFGVEAYENFIGPMVGGMFGSDPAAMPARHALAGLLDFEAREGGLLLPGLKRVLTRDPPPAASFHDGMQCLPETLAETYEAHIHLGTPVTAIRPSADGYRLTTDGPAVTVDDVVVTTRAYPAGKLLADLAPRAPRLLQSLTYNPLAIVHLRADCNVTGLGYQVRPDEGFATLGVSWNASMFDRDGIYTAFLGGMRNHGVIDRPLDEIGAIAAEEFTTVMGVEPTVVNVTRLDHGFPAYDTTWDALDRLNLPPGVHLATNYTARMGVPSRIREARGLAESLPQTSQQ